MGKGSSSPDCIIKIIVVFIFKQKYCGRRGGLMVSALDSGSNGPGSNPGWGTVLYS